MKTKTMFRRCLAGAALALCAAGPAIAADAPAVAADRPYFNFLGGPDPLEGDVDTTYKIEWQFSAPVDFETRFTVSTSADMAPTATPGVDFVAIPPTQVVVAPGQQSGSFDLVIKGDDLPEASELVEIKIDGFSGGGTAIGGGTGPMYDNVYINNDDFPPVPLVANDDYATYVINEGVTVYPGENDLFDEYNQVRDTITTVVTQPGHGTLTQRDYGSGLDYFGYVPDADYTGRDTFRYRLCKSDGIECIEADVHLQGTLRETPQPGGLPRAGGLAVDFDALPAMSDARFVASSLARAIDIPFETGVDATPWNAWDSRAGMAWTTRTLPAASAAAPVQYRVVAQPVTEWQQHIDLRIGVDLDGDGAPSANEQLCAAVEVYGTAPQCDVPITVGAAPVTYWVAMHSREDTALTPGARLFEVAMDAPDSDLTVTGPVTFERGEPVRVMASWYAGTAIGPMVAFVRAVDGTTDVGEFRLDLHTYADVAHLLPSDGTPFAIDLRRSSELWWEERGLFLDVPVGATKLAVNVQGQAAFDVGLVYFADQSPESSYIDRDGISQVRVAPITVPAGQSRIVTVDAPSAGRWYVELKNGADVKNRVQVRTTLQGDGPQLRPGSYYNADQAGHGLLLYPAADQWAGLWYTYDRRGLPTWYYLQAPQPGADGVWRSPVYRDVWTGTGARHTQVGTMTVTPMSESEFLMSYHVDGFAGSQPMAALGRGCPTAGGSTIDISSHWFDPARAGNGYSVQTWDSGYQFIAAFGYDRQGNPLFLAAERPDLGGDVADLPLEYLDGSCPTCGYGPPIRMPAGVLRRTLAGGQLTEITLDVDYPEPAPFAGRRTFTVTDRVQLLGGPGTTQGCAP